MSPPEMRRTPGHDSQGPATLSRLDINRCNPIAALMQRRDEVVVAQEARRLRRSFAAAANDLRRSA